MRMTTTLAPITTSPIMNGPPIAFREAVIGDIAAIKAVADRCRLGEGPIDSGFLVSDFGPEDYRVFIEASLKATDEAAGREVIFLVAVDPHGHVAAFAFAYRKAFVVRHPERFPESSTEQRIRVMLREESDFFVIKQIGIAPEFRKRGLGSQLYFELFTRIATATPSTDCEHVFAATVLTPPNRASEKFHQKMGFAPVLQSRSRAGDGRLFLNQVWHRVTKPLHFETAPDTSYEIDILLQSLQHARELYMHEDNLNWIKFGLLVTFFFALVAAAWQLQSDAGGYYGWRLAFAVLLAGGGYVVLDIFRKKIRSGLKFMAAHKDAVRILESRIRLGSSSFHPAVWMVPHVSETVVQMRQFPLFALIAWTGIAAGMLLRIGGILH
jgi:predicted GNAT superfamily acetyltransferase